MRLNADPTPTPLDRTSVGKTSMGYTAVRLPCRALKNANTAKHATTTPAGAPLQRPTTSNATAMIQ